MLALFNEQGRRTLEFLGKNGVGCPEGANLQVGPLQPHKLESETDEAPPPLQMNEMNRNEQAAMMRRLLEAEEAGIERILERIRKRLSREEDFLLSDYTARYGITEYYVLSEIECFADDIRSETVGVTDFFLNLNKEKIVVLRNVDNKRIYKI